MAGVKLWEACALSLDINPDLLRTEPYQYGMTRPVFLQECFPDMETASDFNKRLRLLESHKWKLRESRTRDDVPLANVAQLGVSFGWKMPSEMVAMCPPVAPPLPQHTFTPHVHPLPESASAETASTKTPATSLEFKMTRTGLIGAHKHEWPTIERDLKNASTNGLAAARAGPRAWDESAAMAWARSRGKLKNPADPLTQSVNSMANLPARKHLLKS